MHADILKEKQYPRVHCRNRLAKQNGMLQILTEETEGDTEMVRPSPFTSSSAPSSLTAVLVSPHQKAEKTERSSQKVYIPYNKKHSRIKTVQSKRGKL